MKEKAIEVLRGQINCMYMDTFTDQAAAERLVEILERNGIFFTDKEQEKK